MNTGVGNVTELTNNTVIANFIDETKRCYLSCVVMNKDIQTDTVWSIENYTLSRITGCQAITSNEIFQISGDQRPTSSDSEFNYGNHLSVSDCSLKELNGSAVHCGSHANPKQVLFEFKVCGKLI